MKAQEEQLKQLGKYEANALLAKELLQPASPENQLGYRTDIEDPEKLAEHLQEQMQKAVNQLNKIKEPDQNEVAAQTGG